ncbi:MAG: DUF4276 family protein [Deltaproteobacteria bacterium]|nr:DUF4276 family protein [Deltaproteobacteria bacterium]
MTDAAGRVYVFVEGHGEIEAISNLLNRLTQDVAPSLPPFAPPSRITGGTHPDKIAALTQRVRKAADARALLVIHDSDGACPARTGPTLAERLARETLQFPVAAVIAHPEYESLFLASLPTLAGRPLPGPGGDRPGIVDGASWEGPVDGRRGVKEQLSARMPPGRIYKPSIDQRPLTRLVDLALVRRSGLAWFETLERALRFLAEHQGIAAATYPPARGA